MSLSDVLNRFLFVANRKSEATYRNFYSKRTQEGNFRDKNKCAVFVLINTPEGMYSNDRCLLLIIKNLDPTDKS